MSWEHMKGKPAWNKGKKMSEEQRAKLSAVHTGVKLSKDHRQAIADGSWQKQHKDESSPYWKGDDISMRGLHTWVQRKLGKPMECENCDTTEAEWYDWANISGEYKRELSDWARLCRQCHNLFDNNALTIWEARRKNGNIIPWNKGKVTT